VSVMKPTLTAVIPRAAFRMYLKTKVGTPSYPGRNGPENTLGPGPTGT
jgi:hypothetical protein